MILNIFRLIIFRPNISINIVYICMSSLMVYLSLIRGVNFINRILIFKVKQIIIRSLIYLRGIILNVFFLLFNNWELNKIFLNVVLSMLASIANYSFILNLIENESNWLILHLSFLVCFLQLVSLSWKILILMIHLWLLQIFILTTFPWQLFFPLCSSIRKSI